MLVKITQPVEFEYFDPSSSNFSNKTSLGNMSSNLLPEKNSPTGFYVDLRL